jgi:flagellar biosynthesis chaperone FliJ
MSKEERQAYDNFIDAKRYNKDVFETALGAKIDKINKELQEKDSQLQEKDNVIQEKDSQLQALAKLLLENGVSKEQIFGYFC